MMVATLRFIATNVRENRFLFAVEEAKENLKGSLVWLEYYMEYLNQSEFCRCFIENVI